MEKHINNQTEWAQTSEEIHFSILINNCWRELKNASLYEGLPKYDEALAKQFRKSGYLLHLKLDFAASGSEVYVPLRYRSVSANHRFFFPAIERNLASDEVHSIDSSRFLDLVAAEVTAKYGDANTANVQLRLRNSKTNVADFLAHFRETGAQVNAPHLSFIEAEQKLVVGHSFHPLTKSREGFSKEDRALYSPETGGRFQIHYFLLHPDLVVEESLAEKKFSQLFREEILADPKAGNHAPQLLHDYPTWKVVPAHPWEARYLLQQSDVQQMKAEGVLFDLGTLGPLYTATSSVRTVYNEQSDWMFKFSLHVKITSAERVNYLSEMYRGYDFNRLLNTSVGTELREQYPDVVFLNDPGFISVSYKGNTIDGFSTSMRSNPFKKEAATKNVGLLASICQAEVMGQPARLLNIMVEAAALQNKSKKEISAEWFAKYIDLLLPPTVTMFEKYGFICELHQQNILIELDARFFPSKLYWRDNQSYLLRDSRKEQLGAWVPGLAENESAFTPDRYFCDLLSHFLVFSNILSVINAFGSNGLISEEALIEILYQKVQQLHERDQSSFTAYLLEKRNWCVKGNLITAIRNIDGGRTPVSVVYTGYPNILHRHFFSRQLIYPEGKEVFYSRYFPKENVTIGIRPIDLDKDLEMLHEWFHRPHAIKTWKMDWPIRQLEAYYRSMIPGDVYHSYIGEANGEPTFNFEVYWATKDPVGDYYPVLPTDYGTHQFIAPTDPVRKFASPSTQCMVDYVFAQPEVGKMVGEGAVDSLAAMMNKAHVGFRIEKVIEMPHKKANLNFCYREWYWAKFPQNKGIRISTEAEITSTI